MNQLPPPPPPFADPLAELLQREFGADRVQPARPHRLEPITLPPPPVDDACASDDIELNPAGDAERRRQLIIAGGGIGLAAVAALAGWLAIGAFKRSPVADAPVIRADQDVLTKAPAPPSVETDTRSAAGVTELVAPNTEGFSPAKRVATQRIIVENDREVAR